MVIMLTPVFELVVSCKKENKIKYHKYRDPASPMSKLTFQTKIR